MAAPILSVVGMPIGFDNNRGFIHVDIHIKGRKANGGISMDVFTMDQFILAIQAAASVEEIEAIARVVGEHRAKGHITEDERRRLETLMVDRYEEVRPRIKDKIVGAGKGMVAHFTREDMREDYDKVRRFGRKAGMIPAAGTIGLLEGLVAGVVIPIDDLVRRIKK